MSCATTRTTISAIAASVAQKNVCNVIFRLEIKCYTTHTMEIHFDSFNFHLIYGFFSSLPYETRKIARWRGKGEMPTETTRRTLLTLLYSNKIRRLFFVAVEIFPNNIFSLWQCAVIPLCNDFHFRKFYVLHTAQYIFPALRNFIQREFIWKIISSTVAIIFICSNYILARFSNKMLMCIVHSKRIKAHLKCKQKTFFY